MTPSLFEPNNESQQVVTASHSDPSALSSLACELTPVGSYSPQARARARDGKPNRSERVTAEFERLAALAIPEDKRPDWWLWAAFDADFQKGGKVLALAFATVDAQIEREQAIQTEYETPRWWAEE